MSKKAHTVVRERQLSLPLPDTSYSKRAGSLRRKEAVREALIAALESCTLSREQIADEMSRLTGEAISVNHINNWTATAKKDWRFPLEYASALMVITGDYGIIDAVIGGTKLSVITQEEAAYVEYGRLLAEEQKQRRKKKAIKEQLGI